MDLSNLFADLPDQFNPAVTGRVLLMDGDFPAYQAAATVKTLKTALTRYQTLVETERFLTAAESVRVHITESGCQKCRREDYPTVQLYQDNRNGKPKPPLLHPLRLSIPQNSWPEYWDVFSWRDREADDGLMQDAVYYGNNAVMVSGDKDLCLTPGPLWLPDEGRIDVIQDRFGWIKQKVIPSATKTVGHGTKFFWAQMLMGDTADNVKGILKLHGKLCGAVGAFNALNGITSEYDAAEFVLRSYMAIGQNPLAEAECLWLRRTPEDSAYKYLSELGLPDNIQQWLDALNQYHIEVLEYTAAMRDYENGKTNEPATSTGTEATGHTDRDCPPWEHVCDERCCASGT